MKCRGALRTAAVAAVTLVVAVLAPSPTLAATPKSGTLRISKDGKGRVAWKGTVSSTLVSAGNTPDACFTDRRPDRTTGCDFFVLNVHAPESVVQRFVGDIAVKVGGFGDQDIDIAVYVRNPNGTVGYPIAVPDDPTAGGNEAGQPEEYPIENPTGPARSYYVAILPFQATPNTRYSGSASFHLKRAKPSLSKLNRRLGAGPRNYRASHDRFVSHSEPSIAMDPTNHNHLIAGSKMYEDLPRYLFKAGTYESFDGGRHWRDLKQLPGYCDAPGQCNPNDEERYRTVSDISLAFDDEGNAYANVLDAPGGTLAFTGFNMTAHVKKRGQRNWSQPIVVHDNRANPITQQTLLDDKNWIAVDNATTTTGATNRPNDGKVGTLYVCWSLDVSLAVPGQQIVLMRSTDGGKSWFGNAPGDPTPKQLSQKTVVGGVGCHVAIGPKGEVYVTWYDNQLDQLMQVKSTDRGDTFTPARPIANIVGVNDPFARQQFRNLSIPTTGVDRDGNVYVAVTSRNGEGSPVLERAVDGQNRKHPEVHDPRDEEADGGDKPGSGSDVVLFKSTNGGTSYSGPVRVNQDARKADADQFQPWLAVTPKGQVDISYFDRRNDPGNDLFIDTYLARSDDGGKTFRDTRVTHRMWDPRVNPPTSASGEFIGDYQGLVADDKVAIPFWNDTQAAALKKGSKGYSPWQEVYAARIPNRCVDAKPPHTSLPRKNARLLADGRLAVHGRAGDKGCGHGLKFVRVSVARYKKEGGRCRFLKRDGGFTKPRSCSKRLQRRAAGKRRWHYTTERPLPPGKYRITASAVDRNGNRERPVLGRNTIKFRVR